MNKELFVSSTPHETKVGMVEDDLLAEVYLERENEYTLAGSIYKGRVTRVLPGMQSAFVDIGLERDAFLYVSDFMELEEHDDDLTEAVPANRGVQDLRPQPVQAEGIRITEGSETEGTVEAERLSEEGAALAESGRSELGHEEQARSTEQAGGEQQHANGGENRERGNWRGRRRRGRGGRRDGRDRGFDRGASDRGEQRERGGERSSESRFARDSSRVPDSGRAVSSGPPAGYTPILLPGESISKYSRYAQQPAASEQHGDEPATEVATDVSGESTVHEAASFPEDEPIFAATESAATESQVEPLHEEHDEIHAHEEAAEPVSAVSATEPSASTTENWNEEFRHDETPSLPALGWPGEARVTVEEEVVSEEDDDKLVPIAEHTDHPAEAPREISREDQVPAFAAPGTIEEETIDEEEADAIRYESSSDEGY
jgi:ribonuclease G